MTKKKSGAERAAEKWMKRRKAGIPLGKGKRSTKHPLRGQFRKKPLKTPQLVNMPASEWWLQNAKSPKQRMYRVMVTTVVANQGLGIDIEFKTDPNLDGTPNVNGWVRFERGKRPPKAGDYYQMILRKIKVDPPLPVIPLTEEEDKEFE